MRGSGRMLWVAALALTWPGCFGGDAGARVEASPALASIEVVPVSTGWPFKVDLILGGGDPDSNHLAWTLDIDDVVAYDGTSLPVTLTHVFAEARTFNVTLTITDGESLSATNLSVDAWSAAAASGLSQQLPLKWIAGFMEDCQVGESLPPERELDGITHDRFDVDPETIGLPYRVDLLFEIGQVAAYPRLSFRDAADRHIPAEWSYTYQTGAMGHVRTNQGLIPVGTVTAIVYTCGDTMFEGSYSAGVH